MNFETESGSHGKAAPGREGRTAGWIKGSALLLAGIVLGMGGWRVWGDIQESHRFRLARQKAERLVRESAPQTEARLANLARQLENLESEVTQASLASRPEAIDVSHLRLQQKRLAMQVGDLDRDLKALTGFIEQAPQRFSLGPDRELLSSEEQQQLADFVTRFDRSRLDLDMLGPEIELAKGRRLQLAAMEAESSRRSQTEAESVQRAQAEALRVQAEAIERAQTESTQRASLEVVRQTQNDLAQFALLRTVTASEPATPREVVHVHPVVSYASAPLVIGSSYPDRYIGYRNPWAYGYCYGPLQYGYGSWRCGYGPWRSGYGFWYGSRRGWW
jgi:hypothetical protein